MAAPIKNRPRAEAVEGNSISVVGARQTAGSGGGAGGKFTAYDPSPDGARDRSVGEKR